MKSGKKKMKKANSGEGIQTMPKFKKGDIVQLKSGGPKMACSKVPKAKNGQVHCQWFVKDGLKSGSFPSESIELDEETKRLSELEEHTAKAFARWLLTKDYQEFKNALDDSVSRKIE